MAITNKLNTSYKGVEFEIYIYNKILLLATLVLDRSYRSKASCRAKLARDRPLRSRASYRFILAISLSYQDGKPASPYR